MPARNPVLYALRKPVTNRAGITWKRLNKLAALADVDIRTFRKVLNGGDAMPASLLRIATLLLEEGLITAADLPSEFGVEEAAPEA